ncbi:MAG TPA: hypothetical protein VNS22_03545 [Geminicoccus sp.]|uniref:hypothetical protein n=1 Tax=Geminicoccus sp. TaxID=2024832 RepID=UPI002C95B863|nr:hypothetical protein [Geminicoccus sp.]HWL67439.1 hypothetical protein [Geminicoccus sp.]
MLKRRYGGSAGMQIGMMLALLLFQVASIPSAEAADEARMDACYADPREEALYNLGLSSNRQSFLWVCFEGKVEPLDESAWDKVKQCAANANEEASKDYLESNPIFQCLMKL